MPFYVLTAGGSLYRMSSAGVATALTLPTGVTISSLIPTRFAVFGGATFAVNGPSRNLWIDPDNTVRPMGIPAPPAGPVLAATGSGNLTGVYRAKQSFLVKDPATGEVLQESPLSPASAASASLSAQKLSVTGVTVSPEATVNARRIYRTTAGGSAYFHWIDVDGNTVTAFIDDLSDAGLALVAAPTDLGNPPGTAGGSSLKSIVEWKGRLWAIPSSALDHVIYTSAGRFYAWDPDNDLTVAPVQIDEFGNQAFVPRRDELGVLKRDSVSKVIGGQGGRFEVVPVANGPGTVAPESVDVFHDIGIFLGEDGVYTFGADGVKNVSEARVHPWFTTDDTFARSEFPNAIGKWDPVTKCYRLLLAAAGQSTLNRWVEYDPREKRWYGPHKTGAYTPCWVALLEDANDLAMPIMASTAGFLYKLHQSTIADDGTAIDMEIVPGFHSGNAPDIEHYWGELSVLSKIEAAGTLTVTPYVGGLDASAGTAITHTLTTGRERLRRIGTGRLCKLVFRKHVLNQGATIFGYELPFHELGRR